MKSLKKYQENKKQSDGETIFHGVFFKTIYKVHLIRDKNVNLDHNNNKNKITQKNCFVRIFQKILVNPRDFPGLLQ